MEFSLQLLALPDEILLQIISLLEPASVIPLHRCCKRLRALTRSDPTLWRSLCAHQEIIDSTPANHPHLNRSEEVAGVIDSWPLDNIDWYDEYKFRHAALSMRWLSSPDDQVKGLTSIMTENTHKDLLISPLDDGTINIWSPGSSDAFRSKPGILTAPAPPDTRISRTIEIGDSAVASSELDRIFVAMHSTLLELSLTTLQLISSTRFPFSISTLSSSVVLPHPLTIGTTLTLHLHDPRAAAPAASTTLPLNYTHYAPLFQPSPLSILHHPNNALYVAGRFPSILCYDRAMWPRLQSTIQNDASLFTLAANGPHGLLAGGTYKGRGSLESYSLLPSAPQQVLWRNRQTAAWDKVLSVAKHGARVIACDNEGFMSWFEQDCRYIVRREKISDPDARYDESYMWRSGSVESGPVRKVIVTEGEGLGVWVGGRVGVLGPGTQDEEEGGEGGGIVAGGELLQDEIEDRMRRALHGQADGARVLGALAGMDGERMWMRF